METFLIIYSLLNSLAFILFGLDKRKAIKHTYRISEKTLLVYCLFVPLGAVLGMVVFHHKTKKTTFKVMIGIGFIATIATAYFYF